MLPLLLSIDRQIAELMPALVQLQQRILSTGPAVTPSADQLKVLASVPDTVITFLSSEDDTTLALSDWLADHPVASLDMQHLPTLTTVLGTLADHPCDAATQHWAGSSDLAAGDDASRAEADEFARAEIITSSPSAQPDRDLDGGSRDSAAP